MTMDNLQEQQEQQRLAAIIDERTAAAMAANAAGTQDVEAEMSSAAANAALCALYGVESLLDSREACEFLDAESRRNGTTRSIGWVGLRRSRRR